MVKKINNLKVLKFMYKRLIEVKVLIYCGCEG